MAVAGALAGGVSPAAANPTLPDNRGYEIVTPPDQDMDTIARFWSTADGNATAFQSLGAFSGALNGSTNGYLTTRGADSWSTHALTPPGGAGRLWYLTDLSDDGQRTLWMANTLIGGSGTDLYVKDGDQPAIDVSGPVEIPGAGETTLYGGRSADASHALFMIDPGMTTTGEKDKLRLYDYTDGVAKPVGILPGQTTPSSGGAVLGSYDAKYGQGSVMNAVSADGSKVFFESPAPPRDPYDHFPYWPSGLYVRENNTTTTEIDPNATFQGASVDGATVVYTPADSGTGNRGLSTYDVAAKRATEIVPTSDQVQGIAGISDDASTIYFVAHAKLDDGATAGKANLYFYDGGAPRFVATLTTPNATSYYFDPGEGADYGGNGIYTPSGPMSDTSADGRILVFLSTQKLTDYDNAGQLEAYRFDADATSDPLKCISCSPTGAPPTGKARLLDNADSNAPAPMGPATNVSADGRRIFFQTPDALDPRDINGQDDVYEWEDGAAHLISSGTGTAAHFNAATPSGDDVFFSSKNVLVPQNVVPGLLVVYDARVGGGFALPAVVTPCEQGGTCQGPASPTPPITALGSATFSGLGNVVPAPAGGKGKTKAPTFKIGKISRQARKRLARTGRITVKVRVGAAGKVRVSMRAKVGKRTRRVARASRTAKKAGVVSIKLSLSKVARRALRQGHRLRVRTVVGYSKAHRSKHASFTVAGAKHGKRGR